MEEVILGLTRTLDNRVFVALGRGLWDFTSKEIFEYVESLQEGTEIQVSCSCQWWAIIRLGTLLQVK